ncbi:MAG: hypothetical protein ACODAF_06775 [Actinomycetota bacterium]
MDAHDKLDQIIGFVDNAKTMPMSSSVLINKADLTRMLEELRAALPEELRAAQKVLRQRDELLSDATANAERLLTAAEEERQRLVSEEEVLREARTQAGEAIRAAREKTEDMRSDVNSYVDAKLAHLEVSVTNILETVRQGRARLSDANAYTELAPSDDDSG